MTEELPKDRGVAQLVLSSSSFGRELRVVPPFSAEGPVVDTRPAEVVGRCTGWGRGGLGGSRNLRIWFEP